MPIVVKVDLKSKAESKSTVGGKPVGNVFVAQKIFLGGMFMI